MKNYYQILNVRPAATDEDIKRSYRILAKRYHPDVNPGDSSAADRFADINEAHDVLSDPQQRAEYDKKLKEAAAPRLKPEDIIARQRAAAQAAARQAAMRNSAAARAAAMQQNAARQAAMRNNASAARAAAYRRDPNLNLAQQRQAAQAASAAAQAAQVHAKAQAQAQAQAAQLAQINAIKNQAYTQGYERGTADAKRAAEKENRQVQAKINALNSDIAKLNDKLADTESDRSDLEKELFHRDRELAKVQKENDGLVEHAADLQSKLDSIVPNKYTDAQYVMLEKQFDKAQARIRDLETAISQAELKSKAQLQLQTDKRKQLQEQASKLQKQVTELTRELEVLRTENNQWQDYAKSEQFLTDAEERLLDWEKKQKADKKLAKPTLYGQLGVLIWATDEQISEAYVKLGKRYQKSDKGEEGKEKFKKITEAYTILSDPEKRAEYNKSIGIDDDRIENERRLIVENSAIEDEYRKQLDNKEFWAKFDEMSFSAQTGDAEAQNSLGELYYYGDEIEQDFDSAVYWFKEAAKQKHAEAMYNLGICFVNGEGTDKNKSTGLGFIRQAAKLGSKSAQKYLSK